MAKLNIPFRYIAGLPPTAQTQIYRDFEEVARVLKTVGSTGFDATIDPDLSADAPTLSQFTTVGAALTYLSGLGYLAGKQLVFLMRGRAVGQFSTTKAVTETGNIPSTVFPTGGLKIIAAGPSVTWNVAGFNVTGSGSMQLTLENIYVRSTGTNATFQGFNILEQIGGGFGGGGTNSAYSSAGFTIATGTWFSNAHPGSGTYAWFSNCVFDCGNVTSSVGVTDSLVLTGCHFNASVSGTTWNITATRAVLVECEFAGTFTSSDSTITLSFNGTTQQCVYLMGGGRGGAGASFRASSVTVNMGGVTKHHIVVMGGAYEDVTTSGVTNIDSTQVIHTSLRNQLDVTGRANINVACAFLKVRGQVNGTAMVGDRANGTIITAIGWVNGSLIVSVTGAALGSCTPYNLDAASSRNILVVSGSNGMLAGVNAGTNNLIITENGATVSPPTGAAGGDLAGNYPNPTLATVIGAGGPTGDATHVPIITWDAKGRLTAVSSALITGVVPATHASTHARGGTDPLDAVFKDFTQRFLIGS